MKRLTYLVLMISLILSLLSCAKSENNPADNKKTSAAPSFNLADVKGNKVKLEDYKGKVVMLEFFATWCAPCKMLATELQHMHETYGNRGLVVLAVSLDEGKDAASAVSSFVKENSISYQVLLDDGKARSEFGVLSLPTSFLIDKQGSIKSKHQGFLPDMSKSISKEIEALL